MDEQQSASGRNLAPTEMDLTKPIIFRTIVLIILLLSPTACATPQPNAPYPTPTNADSSPTIIVVSEATQAAFIVAEPTREAFPEPSPIQIEEGQETATPTLVSTATNTPEPTPMPTAAATKTASPTATPERKPWVVDTPWGPVDLNLSIEKAKAFYDNFMANRKGRVETSHGSWQVFDVPKADMMDWYRDRHFKEGYLTRDYQSVAMRYMEEMKIVSVDPTIHKEPTRSYFKFTAEWLKHDGTKETKEGFIDIGTEIAVPIPAGASMAGREPSIGRTRERITDPSQLQVGEVYGATTSDPKLYNLAIGIHDGAVLVVFALPTLP